MSEKSDTPTTSGEGAPARLIPIDASDFARFLPNHAYAFGVDPGAFAKALRQLADRVERGETLVRRVHVIGIADLEDFGKKRLVFEVVERLTQHPDGEKVRAAFVGEPKP